MNKKRLSVVMAGAMLASSVAPVLAATETEVDSSQLGSLVTKVYDKLTEKVFSDVDENSNVDSVDYRNKSVYYVKINGEKVDAFDIALDTDAGKAELKDELQEKFKTLSAGSKVEIYSYGFAEDDGKVYAAKEAAVPKYELKTTADNEALKAEIETAFNGATYNPVSSFTTTVAGELKIVFNGNVVLDKMPSGYTVENNSTLIIKGGDDKLNFKSYIDSNGDSQEYETSTERSDIKGFPKVVAEVENIDEELIETITITGTTYDYATEDLYDGLMLTTAGHDLLSLIKEVRHDEKAEPGDTTAVIKNLYGYTYKAGDNITDLKTDEDGKYGFVVEVTDAFDKTTVYTVKGEEKQTEILASWLNTELAKVDILAGDNRYETAVKIAKEQAQVAKLNDGETSNIVLVNGNSLVDGLSAASLASSIKAGENADAAAPILLTEADELPNATKTYLKELLADKTVGNLDTKVYLVGGTSVLNKSLVNELEDLGFDVERIGGDNREETSLKVAEAINPDLSGEDVFVVGAEGEADAMSIAGVAAENSTPIIVAKKGGITEDALEVVEGANVTVLGGELSLSAEDYEAIKEDANAVRRIAGENRQATNAAIIKEFYNGATGITAKSVIVAKDGKGDNGQLVDALTAANLAAQTNAPVVLATNSLSAEQIDALNLRAKSSESLYQVGIGVATSVVETIASNLGLLNK